MTIITAKSEVERDLLHAQHDIVFQQKIKEIISTLLPQFQRMMKSYVTFNLIFLTLGFLEFTLLIVFFAFLAKSTVLAISLAFVFLTFFSYFILRIFYQTKKPEQYKEIRDRYISACKGAINYRLGMPEHQVALANACCKLSEALNNQEYFFYSFPKRFSRFSQRIEKMSCWWHWQDVFKLREHLLKVAVNENIYLVKFEPTNLEVHAALANAYVILSGLYADPRKGRMEDDEERWIPPERYSEDFELKFREVAGMAIEELKILNSFAPHDPWVHAQLAYSYHDLGMPEEEIKEYEILMKIHPEDKEILYKLGMLYFHRGMNALGLRIYEELKKSHPKKAEALIKSYGAYEQFVFY